MTDGLGKDGTAAINHRFSRLEVYALSGSLEFALP